MRCCRRWNRCTVIWDVGPYDFFGVENQSYQADGAAGSDLARPANRPEKGQQARSGTGGASARARRAAPGGALPAGARAGARQRRAAPGGRRRPGGPLECVCPARRATGLPAAMESRPQDRHRGADEAGQADRLPQRTRGRRHQISVGAQPPPGTGGAGPGLERQRRAALRRRRPRAAAVVVCAMPVSERRALDQLPGAGGAAGQLVGGLAVAGRRRFAAVCRAGGPALRTPVARQCVPALPFHPRLFLAPFLGQQPFVR